MWNVVQCEVLLVYSHVHTQPQCWIYRRPCVRKLTVNLETLEWWLIFPFPFLFYFFLFPFGPSHPLKMDPSSPFLSRWTRAPRAEAEEARRWSGRRRRGMRRRGEARGACSARGWAGRRWRGTAGRGASGGAARLQRRRRSGAARAAVQLFFCFF